MKLRNIILSIFCLLITNLNAISLREYITTNGMPEIEMSEGNFILNLSNKNLTDVDGLKDIPGITQVTILNLEHNQISKLSEGLFNTLVHLKKLYLAYNQITELPENIFNSLNNLRYLFLDNNQISELPEGLFNTLINLYYLNLSDNQISKLPEGLFHALINLKVLYLNNNLIRELSERIFNALDLQYVYIANNQIRELPENIFITLVNLRSLDLSNNQIRELPENIFNVLVNLIYLYLNNNQIRELPENIFNALVVNLIYLELSNNPIKLTTEEFRNNYLTRNNQLATFNFKTPLQEVAESLQRKLIEYIKTHNVYSTNIMLELLQAIKEWYPNLYVAPQSDENDDTILHLVLQSRNLNLAKKTFDIMPECMSIKNNLGKTPMHFLLLYGNPAYTNPETAENLNMISIICFLKYIFSKDPSLAQLLYQSDNENINLIESLLPLGRKPIINALCKLTEPSFIPPFAYLSNEELTTIYNQ